MHALAPTMPADLRAILESLGVDPRGERPRSERVLERLLDLNRCVALGGVLDLPARTDIGDPEERLAREEASLARLRTLEDKLVASLRELRVQLDRRFEHAFGGARGLPDAEALHALLSESGALQAGSTKRGSAAAKLAPRYVAIVEAALGPALKELAWLHKDVQQALQQGAADTQRLAALDLVLDGMFRAELAQARAQLEARLGSELEQRLRASLAALPEGASVDALRPWFLPRGCVGHFMRDARRLCHALLDLEWSALMSLVQAAMQHERSLSPEASPDVPSSSTDPSSPDDIPSPEENDAS